MSEALIIGAGPAGLTAAYELSKHGVQSTVLEADDQVGGISRTVSYQGYRFDIGGHRFFSKVPLINELWHEILNEDFLVRPRLSRIYYQQHFFDYPLKALNALTGLGPLESLLVFLSYAKVKLFPNHEEHNFEQWVSNRFGHRLYNIFFKTYTEKVWGIPCTEISADWAAQRIKNLSLREAVRNALFGAGRTADGEIITTLIDQFHYPRLGPGMMWECCESLLAQRGSATMRGVHIDTIQHRRGRVESILGHTQSGERVEFDGSHFISTMPLRELIHALSPAPPDEVVQAAHRLRYRDYLTVVLIVNRQDIFPDNWIYIHAPEVKMGRIQNYKSWSPAMVPDLTRTSLGLEYFLWDKDQEWQWPDQQLIELGVKECTQLGLIRPEEVEDGTVVRMQKAYPVYEQNYRETIDVLRAYLATFSNLQTIGRNGLHRYNNQDHSMLTGVYAARNVTGAKYDVWSVNTEMEYHEAGTAPSAEHSASVGDRLVPARVQPVATTDLVSPDALIDVAFARLDPVALGVALGTVSGLSLCIATLLLLFQAGPRTGETLALLRHYLFGFHISWVGALIGFVEAGLGGFLLGYVLAWTRNWGLDLYARTAKRRADAAARRRLLDEV